MSLQAVAQHLQDIRRRHGLGAMLLTLLHTTLNRLCYYEWLELIVLERAALKPLPADRTRGFEARVATREELVAMARDPQWDIGADKLGYFDAGDLCVLSLLDGQLAGYTWVHAQGLPDLLPGLRLRLPGHVLYNYAGLTAPAFRGAGLQSLRHHSVLAQPCWRDRDALVGYVRRSNHASRNGQRKSGYRRIGALLLIGSRPGRHLAWLSPGARRFGIALADPRGPAQAEPPAAAEAVPQAHNAT